MTNETAIPIYSTSGKLAESSSPRLGDLFNVAGFPFGGGTFAFALLTVAGFTGFSPSAATTFFFPRDAGLFFGDVSGFSGGNTSAAELCVDACLFTRSLKVPSSRTCVRS
jgi:S1-C subfamily serine protease